MARTFGSSRCLTSSRSRTSSESVSSCDPPLNWPSTLTARSRYFCIEVEGAGSTVAGTLALVVASMVVMLPRDGGGRSDWRREGRVVDATPLALIRCLDGSRIGHVCFLNIDGHRQGIRPAGRKKVPREVAPCHVPTALSVPEMLRIMDVATTLRQDRELVEEQLNLDTLKERLRERMLAASKVTGEAVTPEEVDAAIRQYYASLHTFREPKLSFPVFLAHAWVRRKGLLGIGAAGLLSVAAFWWLYLSPDAPMTERGRNHSRVQKLAAEFANRALTVRSGPFGKALPSEVNRLVVEAEVSRAKGDPRGLESARKALDDLESMPGRPNASSPRSPNAPRRSGPSPPTRKRPPRSTGCSPRPRSSARRRTRRGSPPSAIPWRASNRGSERLKKSGRRSPAGPRQSGPSPSTRKPPPRSTGSWPSPKWIGRTGIRRGSPRCSTP